MDFYIHLLAEVNEIDWNNENERPIGRKNRQDDDD